MAAGRRRPATRRARAIPQGSTGCPAPAIDTALLGSLDAGTFNLPNKAKEDWTMVKNRRFGMMSRVRILVAILALAAALGGTARVANADQGGLGFVIDTVPGVPQA